MIDVSYPKLGMGIVPSKRRWERKMRARDRSVKFQGQTANNVDKVRISLALNLIKLSFLRI